MELATPKARSNGFGGMSSSRRRRREEAAAAAAAAAVAKPPPSSPPKSSPPKSPSKKPAPSKLANVPERKEELLLATSDDLTAKMRAWAHQVETSYANSDGPSATVTVTIHAVTGVDLQEPFWMAAVSGSVDETGTATPLEEASPSGWPPKGCPSWSAEPLTLPVHDVSSDLLLLLCESEGTAATRACIGRVVVPLTELLPLNPFGGQPVPQKLWADIFPPAPEYACGQVHATFGAALDSVRATGMPVAAAGQQGRALISVSLEMHKDLLTSYCNVAPFDALADHPGSSRHERPPLAAERILLAMDRLHAIAADGLTPAAVRVARKQSPWLMGLAMLGMAYWACYDLYLSTVPWWLLALYVLNCYAVRAQGLGPTEPWEPTRPPPRSDAASNSIEEMQPGMGLIGMSAEAKLQRLEESLLPVVQSLESLASNLERAATAPLASDPRAAVMALLPIAFGAFCAAAALYVVSAFVLIAGGPQNFVFEVAAGLFVWNLASYHQREIWSCTGDDDGDEDSQRAAAAKNPFAPVTAHMRESAAQRSLEMAEDGEWLDSERRTAISGTVSSIWQNIFLRVPDVPTQVHRAIARAALTDADDSRGGHCLPCL